MLDIILFIIIPLVLLLGGIYSLIRYKKTKQKQYLILGLILTVIFIGYVTLLVLAFTRDQSQVLYMPGPNF